MIPATFTILSTYSSTKFSQHWPDLSPETKISPKSSSFGSCCCGSWTRNFRMMMPIIYFSSVIARLEPGQPLEPWPKGVQL